MKDYVMALITRAKGFAEDEKGQALVEYALVLLLIAIVVVLMLSGIGGTVNNAFSAANSGFSP